MFNNRNSRCGNYALLSIVKSSRNQTSEVSNSGDYECKISFGGRQGALYASHPPVTRRMATLATGLPATALTGLDLHQLDFNKKFH